MSELSVAEPRGELLDPGSAEARLPALEHMGMPRTGTMRARSVTGSDTRDGARRRIYADREVSDVPIVATALEQKRSRPYKDVSPDHIDLHASTIADQIIELTWRIVLPFLLKTVRHHTDTHGHEARPEVIYPLRRHIGHRCLLSVKSLPA